MTLTYTPAADLGQPLHDFLLPHVDGTLWNSENRRPLRGSVIMFICNHCPYVKAVEDRLIDLAHRYKDQFNFVAICSNDASEYPEDRPEELLRRSIEKRYDFPYLVDQDQTVARALGAVCTPDFFVFNGHDRLYYRGRLDDSWKDPAKVNQRELEAALNSILEGRPAPQRQIPSMGCSIKWKEPSDL